MKLFFISLLTLFLFLADGHLLSAQDFSSPIGSWGDQGNGTYINPVLNADYSDPDVIRVGEDYYMVCSEFHFMGIPVLHSKDLVNWTIIARVYDEFKFAPEYDTNDRYAGGSWAPAIRYHDNKYWVYFCTPKEGLFMTTAEKPEGPWEPLTQVVNIAGWEDPCPFWDENGQAYLGRSKVGAGPIYIHKMSADGKKLLDDGVIVYTGPVAEGTKIHQLKGYYYLSIPEGGVERGWQTILRSKNIYGPFEKKVVLEKGSTPINGPHQGAMIDLPNGDWWFIHFQSVNNIGRVCHLQPMRWKDDWPVMGVDIDMNGIGEPVYVWKKPDVGTVYPITVPQTSDEFNKPQLDFQWSWNHNPVNDQWSLTQKKDCLLLNALPATSFLKAKNTLTQKVMGSQGEATTFLLADQMNDGQKAGLCLMGKQYNLIGIVKASGKLSVFADLNGKMTEQEFRGSKIYLRVHVTREESKNQFDYSTDNKHFLPLGDAFTTNNGYWKGPKIGLFSYNEKEQGGTAKFDWFHYLYDESQSTIKYYPNQDNDVL
ncbi:MAG: glycoside hydrolase 43 family protein [Labilibaculum sp.]|nr:glycoside hydrolase 43 family protein [Labilibaculum sp.]